MSDWKSRLRAKLAHLPDSVRESTIQQVIEDTEAGRPFGMADKKPAPAEADIEADTPAPGDRAGAAPNPRADRDSDRPFNWSRPKVKTAPTDVR